MVYAAVFAALAIYVFWGTWSTDFSPVMPDSDTTYPKDYLSYVWGQWLHDGRFAPWDLAKFLGSPYFWTELRYALSLGLSGIALAWFLKARGLGEIASYGAGLLLAFCGYWSSLFSAGHLGWFQWMSYGVFAFLFIEKALKTDKLKYWLLLGAVVAWGSFYQPDLWLIFSAFTLVYLALRLIEEHRFPWKKLAISFAAFSLIILPSFYNAVFTDMASRKDQISESGEDKWTFVTNWSLPPAETAEFFLPRINGDTSCRITEYFARKDGRDTTHYTGDIGAPLNMEGRGFGYRQHSIYVGFVTMALALLGVILAWRKSRFFAFAALVFLLLSFGRYFSPAYRLIYALPIGDMIRCPIKWHHLTEFCLVILAAYGIDGLLAKAKNFKYAYLIIIAFISIGICDLARIDRRYLAPVNHTLARSRGEKLAFTPTQSFPYDLDDKRFFAYIKGQIESQKGLKIVGKLPNNSLLLSVSSPFDPPGEPQALAIFFGIVSLLSAVFVIGFSFYTLKKEKTCSTN